MNKSEWANFLENDQVFEPNIITKTIELGSMEDVIEMGMINDVETDEFLSKLIADKSTPEKLVFAAKLLKTLKWKLNFDVPKGYCRFILKDGNILEGHYKDDTFLTESFKKVFSDEEILQILNSGKG